MTTKPRRKIYLTDRDDNGQIFGYLIAVDDDYVYDVELASHLRVLSSDGYTTITGQGLGAVARRTE